MEIYIVIIGTILIPLVIIGGLFFLTRKFDAAQKKREALIEVMEEIIEIQSDSIDTLRY